MLGFDWFLWGPLLVAGVGALVKVIWPSKAKQVDQLLPIFEAAWKTVEGMSQTKDMSSTDKHSAFLAEVHEELEVRGVKPKVWMKTAADHFARTLSAAAKADTQTIRSIGG